MKIVDGFPPNISTIRQYITPPPDAVFAYGDIIYNPSGKDIPEDVLVHEQVHEKQMKNWLPDTWWLKYLLDKDFRKQAEVEAYSVQYRFVKERVPAKVAKLCLHDLASNLQKLYDLDITYWEASTLIRKFKI